jgi:hypothetical protein
MNDSEKSGAAAADPNGAAMAAVLAAGIGAFVLGLLVILGEAGLFAAPAFYKPAGGLSGRSTLAVAAWLVAWAAAHAAWKDRDVSARGVWVLSLALIGLGLVMTFPPVWSILG